MNGKFKIVLFIALVAICWIPFIQELTQFRKEPQLQGAFVKPPKPEFSVENINTNKFQQAFEDYQNWNFGFRALFVKLKNSVEYILFRKLNAPDITQGPEGYIYSQGSIERTIGNYYNGKEKNDSTIYKIKFLYDNIKKRGGRFLVVIAPSKESIIPEYLPAEYKKIIKPNTDYADLVAGYNQNNIPYIDFLTYFKNIKSTSNYPLFTKTGFHWSSYGASIAQDSLIKYMQTAFNKLFPSYSLKAIEKSDTARDADDDFEGPMNLLFSLNENAYYYPIYNTTAIDTSAYRPKVIVIGDSYFWQIKGHNNIRNVFSDDSKYWYYFSNSFPFDDRAGTPVNKLDIINELNTADYVVLFGNTSTLDKFPYGVTDYYYNYYSKKSIDISISDYIRNNVDWNKKIELEAKAKNINYELLLEEQTASILKNSKRISLKAANNKYLCADGEKDNKIIADRDNAWAWETFTLIKLDKNKCALISYRNKFWCAELHSKNEITANRDYIGNWETFEIVELPNNYIALKASNGNYLSLSKDNSMVYANSKKVGDFEKFKMFDQQ